MCVCAKAQVSEQLSSALEWASRSSGQKGTASEPDIAALPTQKSPPQCPSIMTAETLKPFITPTSAGDGFPARPTSADTAQRRTRQMLPFVLMVFGLVLVTCILGLTVRTQPGCQINKDHHIHYQVKYTVIFQSKHA